jgi:signal recognition particle subunit SRP54
MLDTLTQRLASVIKTVRGHARLTEDNVQEALRSATRPAEAGNLPVVQFCG